MFPGVAEVIFFVTDVAVSRTWYVRLLDAEPVAGVPPGLVAFQIGPRRRYLAPADEKTPVTVGGQVAYCDVTDLDAAVRAAQDLGATLFRRPIDVPMEHLRVSQMRDPMGNVLGMLQRTR